MPKRSSKQPRDYNQLAKSIVDIATGQAPPETVEELTPEQIAARILGSKGGKKGGPARAKSMSAKKRKQIATKAAKARWSSKKTTS